MNGNRRPPQVTTRGVRSSPRSARSRAGTRGRSGTRPAGPGDRSTRSRSCAARACAGAGCSRRAPSLPPPDSPWRSRRPSLRQTSVRQTSVRQTSVRQTLVHHASVRSPWKCPIQRFRRPGPRAIPTSCKTPELREAAWMVSLGCLRWRTLTRPRPTRPAPRLIRVGWVAVKVDRGRPFVHRTERTGRLLRK
jgi:hypothetical protein